MIEVEKKFLLNMEQEKQLLEGAEFLTEKVFTDIYYDDANYSLTANDKWLRQRGNKWELKLPFNKIASERLGDLYDEIEDENEIRKILGSLEDKYVCGKVIEYLRCKNKKHFMALVDSGVIKPEQV